MADIQLPSAIDPDARHVEFRVTECRDCGEVGPVAQAHNPLWFNWGNDHADRTGHKRVYQYTLTRNIGEITTVAGAQRRPRRQLGTRGA